MTNTNKPSLTDNSDENFRKIISYIDTVKEEISFNIDYLSKKIETLRTIINNSSGGEK